MGLNIKNEETHQLAMQLASLTGETMTRAVTIALQERLEREKRRRHRVGIAARLLQIAHRCTSRPVLDERHPDDVLGYDAHGLPS